MAKQEGESSGEAMTAIKSCLCIHAGQDAIHGKGMRVHNRTKQNKPRVERQWRCTVCGATKS